MVDGQGRKVAGKHEVEPTAFFIHGAAHRSKPDAKCVLHTHMPFATTLTVVHGGRIEAVSQIALKFYGRDAYDDNYNGLALDAAEGARIVAGLKNADILFLANHGVIVTGPSIDLAFDDLYYLERACMLQVLGMGTGKPLRQVPDAIARKTAAQMTDDTQARLHFVALKRLLDVRRVVGLRNSAHSMVKLINPSAGQAIIVSSYTHREYAESMSAVFQLMGSTALLLRGTEGEAVADARRLPQMDGFVRGQHVVLEEGQKGTLTELPDLTKDIDAASTAAYIRDVLEERRPVPASMSQQVEHILRLASA
jgi:ribulose-5-phosphate 4-epimerase/fuculose-1-phosphate aldolase